MSNPDEGNRDARNETVWDRARGLAVQSGVTLPGVEGASDYELIHDPDEDELTLWIGDLLIARCTDSAKAHIEHLATTSGEPNSVAGVRVPSVADPECGFTVAVDGSLFLLLDDELYTIACAEGSDEIVGFLADATSGGDWS